MKSAKWFSPWGVLWPGSPEKLQGGVQAGPLPHPHPPVQGIELTQKCSSKNFNLNSRYLCLKLFQLTILLMALGIYQEIKLLRLHSTRDFTNWKHLRLHRLYSKHLLTSVCSARLANMMMTTVHCMWQIESIWTLYHKGQFSNNWSIHWINWNQKLKLNTKFFC